MGWAYSAFRLERIGGGNGDEKEMRRVETDSTSQGNMHEEVASARHEDVLAAGAACPRHTA